MAWIVSITGKTKKQAAKLPKTPNDIYDRFYLLTLDLQNRGAVLPHRPHFSKIRGKKDSYHCHLNKNRPIYVVCWRVVNNTIEVYYVGTHENAPY
jgi:hypothetical protein